MGEWPNLEENRGNNVGESEYSHHIVFEHEWVGLGPRGRKGRRVGLSKVEGNKRTRPRNARRRVPFA